MIFHHISIIARSSLYLDPGSGSLLIQILLAAIIGIGVLVRVFWTKIRVIFSAKKSPTVEAGEEEDDQ